MRDECVQIICVIRDDWADLYINSVNVMSEHSIDAKAVVMVLEYLGFSVAFDYIVLPDTLIDEYDGNKLPKLFRDIGIC